MKEPGAAPETNVPDLDKPPARPADQPQFLQPPATKVKPKTTTDDIFEVPDEGI